MADTARQMTAVPNHDATFVHLHHGAASPAKGAGKVVLENAA